MALSMSVQGSFLTASPRRARPFWVRCSVDSSHKTGEVASTLRFNIEGLGGLEVDEKDEVGWLQYWQVTGLLAVENPANVVTGLAITVSNIRPVADQSTGINEFTRNVDCWHGVAGRYPHELVTFAEQKRVGADD